MGPPTPSPTPIPTHSPTSGPPTPPPANAPTLSPTSRSPTPPPTQFPTHSPTPPTLLSPGCYYKQAMASSKCPGPFLDWERDVWGEANANSGASLENCMARKAGHDGYCEVSTAWRFV